MQAASVQSERLVCYYDILTLKNFNNCIQRKIIFYICAVIKTLNPNYQPKTKTNDEKITLFINDWFMRSYC